MLKDALIELMQDKNLSSITVRELCERADVNRSTFYTYFGSPSELLNEIENDVTEQILTTISPSKDTILSTLTNFFEYIRNNEHLFRVLLYRTQDDSFRQRLFMIIISYYSQNPESEWSRIEDKEKARSALLFVAAGAVELVRDWMNRGYYCSAEKLADWILKITSAIPVIT